MTGRVLVAAGRFGCGLTVAADNPDSRVGGNLPGRRVGNGVGRSFRAGWGLRVVEGKSSRAGSQGWALRGYARGLKGIVARGRRRRGLISAMRKPLSDFVLLGVELPGQGILGAVVFLEPGDDGRQGGMVKGRRHPAIPQSGRGNRRSIAGV